VITVSAAQPGDVPAIVGLLEELRRYYGVTETEARGRRMAQVSEMLFGSPPTAYLLLARDEDGAAGSRDGAAGRDERRAPGRGRDGGGAPGREEEDAAREEVGWDGGLVVGIAAYSFLWPAVGTARSLFLKELYVAEGYRRRGVGRVLMRAVFETATVLGCARVEWTTDPDNAAALAFYAGLGMATHPKVFYRAEPWTSLL
jgi:ribosomal protein S18 acetylase RimI-like enzyme